jgi:arylsulfatase A-like enzyme
VFGHFVEMSIVPSFTRRPGWLLPFLFWGVALFATPWLKAEEGRPRPNILLILADDIGWSDIGAMGSEITTPNLDALARGGLVMPQFYNNARCCPSRASLLTGLYPHQAGVGLMTEDEGPENPGYRGTLQPNTITIAEALKTAGYRTYMVGKWHLRSNRANVTPIDRGFDEFYGMLGGFNTFWVEDPFYTRWPAKRTRRSYAPGAFYSTTAFADYALDFIGEGRAARQPWFLYLSFNAAHFPLHAPAEVATRYEQTYFEKGWDGIRADRFQRMQKLGWLTSNVEPSGREAQPANKFNEQTGWAGKELPAWSSLPEDRRRDLARRMAVYAAMIEIMDSAIGRVVGDLRAHGELDNTLVLFLSDNGACAEWDPYGFDGKSGPTNTLHTGADLAAIGGPKSYVSYGTGWAYAANTPWRSYKSYLHEGGIRTPLIAHWPQQIRAGTRCDFSGHIVDIMPTLLEISGATHPRERDGVALSPIAGQNLLPAFRGEKIARRDPLFFEHEGNRAVRDGDWKLVGPRDRVWELYNLAADPTELHNLAARQPERVAALAARWEEWARTHSVIRTKPRASSLAALFP